MGRGDARSPGRRPARAGRPGPPIGRAVLGSGRPRPRWPGAGPSRARTAPRPAAAAAYPGEPADPSPRPRRRPGLRRPPSRPPAGAHPPNAPEHATCRRPTGLTSCRTRGSASRPRRWPSSSGSGQSGSASASPRCRTACSHQAACPAGLVRISGRPHEVRVSDERRSGVGRGLDGWPCPLRRAAGGCSVSGEADVVHCFGRAVAEGQVEVDVALWRGTTSSRPPRSSRSSTLARSRSSAPRTAAARSGTSSSTSSSPAASTGRPRPPRARRPARRLSARPRPRPHPPPAAPPPVPRRARRCSRGTRG